MDDEEGKSSYIATNQLSHTGHSISGSSLSRSELLAARAGVID